MDKELKNIAVALYAHEIDGLIPDLLLGCDEDSAQDCNDGVYDLARQHIYNDDKTFTVEENNEIAQAVADYYFNVEDDS